MSPTKNTWYLVALGNKCILCTPGPSGNILMEAAAAVYVKVELVNCCSLVWVVRYPMCMCNDIREDCATSKYIYIYISVSAGFCETVVRMPNLPKIEISHGLARHQFAKCAPNEWLYLARPATHFRFTTYFPPLNANRSTFI